MKKTLLLSFIVFYTFISHGQTLIGAAGDVQGSNNVILSYSIGETVIETYENSVTLTQGFQQTTDINITVQESAKNEFLVYPNPCVDKLTLSLPSRENITIRILDMHGRTVFSCKKKNDTLPQLNVAILSNGVYVLKVSSEDGHFHESVLIQKIN